MFSLVANRLLVSYGTQVAVDIPHLSLQGNIVALLGHNGAGKSTFIKTLLGLLSPQRGTVHALDASGTRLSPEESMAFCPETGSVFEDITVEEYVALWCRLRHRNSRYYRHEGKEILELLEIAPLLSKKGRELSKGQRRRVQTAIGFLTRPKLFLFDEPFDGLDVQKTQELADIIQKSARTTSFIISSHRMDVMERLADRALVLEEGKLAAAGSIEETCQALAGQSIIISNAAEPERLRDALRQHHPNVRIYQSGSQLTLASSEVTLDAVYGLAQLTSNSSIRVLSAKSSLTDAMSFHLQVLSQRM